MSLFKKPVKNFFCAFCRSPRTANLQKHIGFFEVLLSIVGSTILMFLFFQGFDPRAFAFVAIFLSLFEFFVQFKYRLAMICPHCGFDPLLYLKSKEKACAQVKEYLERRKNDPMVYLSSRPKLDLPVVVKKKDIVGREKIIVTRPHVAKNLDLKM